MTKTRLIAALAADDGSTRLKAALAIGSNPDPELLDLLVARCAIEPDFRARPVTERFPTLHNRKCLAVRK